MENQDPQILEKIRQQFNSAPYPRVPLEKTPVNDVNGLFIHNMVTSYYLRYQQVVNPKDKVILDAGCGSGYKALNLAYANPGAKIVGIDISEESVKLAEQRLLHYGFTNSEFHVLSIYDLPSLGLEFDYINNDEVLYLLPDPVGGLQAMKSVLKPKGIIRSNLHNAFQRTGVLRAQQAFKLVGLMEDNPEETAIEIVRDTMKALHNWVDVKARTWGTAYEGPDSDGTLLANHLLVGDKGFTSVEMFEYLQEAELEFISMVNWRHWLFTDLFQEPDNLPAFWGMSLPEAAIEDQIRLFELFHPVHRLLDFWCGHPNAVESYTPIADYSDDDWLSATVYLHPQLITESFKTKILEAIAQQKPLDIFPHLSYPARQSVMIDSQMAACLKQLWESPQTVLSLVQWWLRVYPVNPLTLVPLTQKEALEQVKLFVSKLETFLYLLLETNHSN